MVSLTWIFFQVLCLANLVFAVWFVDLVLDHQFVLLGTNWIKSEQRERFLYSIFPRITRCDFVYSGSGGKFNELSMMCILSQNIISEKVFLILWFWFMFLGILTAFNILATIAMSFNNVHMRTAFLMKVMSTSKIKHVLESNPQAKRKITELSFGRFLFLYMLGRNTEFSVYKRILEVLILGKTQSDKDQQGLEMLHMAPPASAPEFNHQATIRAYNPKPSRVLSYPHLLIDNIE